MSAEGDVFARYANAEKELCEKTGAFLAQAMLDIEVRYGIKIAEFRVTMDPSGPFGALRANCTLVREYIVPTDTVVCVTGAPPMIDAQSNKG